MRYTFLNVEVFRSFIDKFGEFKEHLCRDIEGMIYLYETSCLSIEGENVLEHAINFTTMHPGEFINGNKDQYLSILVSHALELPLIETKT